MCYSTWKYWYIGGNIHWWIHVESFWQVTVIKARRIIGWCTQSKSVKRVGIQLGMYGHYTNWKEVLGMFAHNL